ncbi:MAG TPA: HEAT repeat domain-containing protein [candidate division Zixibacteria bacterium]|nr:HEAT repeat domain-containing protein [candidate division Zixibacteria bacterium]
MKLLLNTRRNVILLFCLFVLIGVGGGVVDAATSLDKRVDSLFVIASSGEIKYQKLVQPAIDRIAAIGVDAVPLLVDKMTTKSARERLTITNILKKIGSPAVPYLVQSLNNPDPLIVQRVCYALGDIRDTAATMPLTRETTDPVWQVREQSLDALGKLADMRAESAVVGGLTDTIGQVRKAATVAVGRIGIEKSVVQLVHILGDDFYGARMSAVDALMKMDTSKVIPAVHDSMTSPNPFVGDLGCFILGKIGSDRALNILMEQAINPDPRRRAHAVEAVIYADPLDNCGFRKGLIADETNRLVLLKITSAIQAVQHE